MKATSLLFTFVVLIGVFATSGCHETTRGTTAQQSSLSLSDKQLNISILLDLSDRIEPTKYPNSPEHYERDIEAVESVVDFFIQDMEKKGAFAAKGKIRTIFSPPPDNPNVNAIARHLNVDLQDMTPAEKKVVHDSLGTWYRDNLLQIYQEVIDTKQYVGADIWRFFKDGLVKDYCIEPDSNYRNILLVLTDGYLYHDQSRDRQDNRTAFVTGLSLQQAGLRNNPTWRKRFEDQGFGLISSGQQLSNLEVLVLEINPSAAHPNDWDILLAYWGDWLENMNVTRYRLVQTDLPVNSRNVILRFLQGSES